MRIRYGGGKLAADLTLPRLREHWPDPTPQAQAQAVAEWRRDPAASLEEMDKAVVYPPGGWLQATQRVDEHAHGERAHAEDARW